MFDDTVLPKRPAKSVFPDATTLPRMFLERVKRSGPALAFQHKEDGHWKRSTWLQFHDAAASLATWLLDRDLRLGDKVTIVGSTRPEWCIADMGGLLSGAVTVGAYPTLTPDQLAYILEHSDSRVAFVEDQEQLDKIVSHKNALPKLEHVVVWRYDQLTPESRQHPWVVAWKDVLSTPLRREDIDARVEQVDPLQTAIIVYTSGTTGPPKGAMISHRNIATILSEPPIMDFDEDDITLSFLPMAHVAERILAFYGRVNYGTATAYASSIPAVLEEVKEVRPTVFGSVPRIFEKAYARIQGEVTKAPPSKQKVFRWAEGTGKRMLEYWQRGERAPLLLSAQYRLADRMVFSKLRGVFGGRVKFFVTGAAPIPRQVLDFFWSAGFPIYEVYGMTEATVVSHANKPGSVRLGSVGRAFPFVEEKLAPDGEILVRGKTVFQGYYKNEEATRETIDDDGFLHTGDIGKRDADGYLYIVDRKKHIIITAGGKNLTPANIENEIKAVDPIISQVHAHGDRRAFVTAMITLSPMDAIDYAAANGLAPDAGAIDGMKQALMRDPLARPDGLAELMRAVTQDAALRRRITEAVKKGNEKLSRVEQVKRVFLLERELSLEEDEITPTLKAKRKNIEKKFASEFDRLYEDAAFGIVVQEQ
ncbi:MAG: long-chain fatty acid--CoA ligase [Polyangiaceae bacterium]